VASEDIRDFLTALSAAGVEFVIVGAHALAAHGRVRATGDLDVLVRASRDNALKLEQAIREFAGRSLEYFGVSIDELSTSRVGFYMGVEPDRIDIMTRIAGVRFERAWKGRLEAVIEGIGLPVLGFEDLVAAKRASVRKRPAGSLKAMQDAADLAWLLTERERRRSG
jgi:predicted nucleotidyltransferase